MHDRISTLHSWLLEPAYRLLGPDEINQVVQESELKVKMNGQVHRTRMDLAREYDVEKYGSILIKGPRTIEEAMKFELGHSYDVPLVFCVGNKLYQSSWPEFLRLKARWIDFVLHSINGSRYCDLGCGYGYHISRFEKGMAYGGEFSRKAVELGRQFSLDINYFDFESRETYSLIKDDSVVFTVGAVQMLRSAKPFIDSLRLIKNKIRCVVNFETVLLPEKEGIFSGLRSQYTLRSDYNRDLFHLLFSDDEIEVIWHNESVLGRPLDCQSVFIWRFK